MRRGGEEKRRGVGKEFEEERSLRGEEEVCERRNPYRRDERRCLALPCCHFNRDYGGCWSSVGDGPCTAPGISGEEVCQWRNPDRRDERRCLALPCCHFNRDPFDKEGFGLC